jgi:hypothetical protein
VHGEVESVNAAARSECAARADCVFAETAFGPGDLYDGEHPNATGQTRWVESMRRALAEHADTLSFSAGKVPAR